jgi:hypothetical protein
MRMNQELAISGASVWRPCRSKAGASGPGIGNSLQALTSQHRRRELSFEAVMANVSEFSIVTYLRKPGHWRAAIFPKARIGRGGGETVLSIVTPNDFPSEAEAQLSAEQLIRKF